MEALVGAGGPDVASSSTVLTAAGHDIHQTGNQRNEMLVRNLPNEIEANIAIAVDESMTHAYDLPPRDIGIASFRIGGDLAGCFAKYFERANDRILVQTAGKEGGLVETFDEGAG